MLNGVQRIGDYTTPVGDVLKVTALRNLLPNPDSLAGSDGAVALPNTSGVGNSYLDEMSPMCAAQLRVELNALIAVVT
jgi:hypothetical protein